MSLTKRREPNMESSVKADLVCMRLADMTRAHPEQIEDKCSKCGETVGIYPSGQRILAQKPGTRIVCHICYVENISGYTAIMPALGALQETKESVSAVKGKPRAQ